MSRLSRYSTTAAPVPVNAHAIQTNVVPVQATLDWKQLQRQCDSNADVFSVVGGDASILNIRPHEFVFGPNDQVQGGIPSSSSGASNFPLVQSALNGFDGYGVSLSQLKREVQALQPGEHNKALVERIIAHAAESQIHLLGVAQLPADYAMPGAIPTKNVRTTTIAVGGSNTHTAEVPINAGQLLRVVVPTETEIRERAARVYSSMGSTIVRDKVTLRIEPFDPSSFAQSFGTSLAAFNRHAALYTQLLNATEARVGASEIWALELFHRSLLATIIRGVGVLMDVGLNHINVPVAPADVSRMANDRFGVENVQLPAPVAPAQFVMPRDNVADIAVHPRMLLTPFVRSGTDANRAAWSAPNVDEPHNQFIAPGEPIAQQVHVASASHDYEPVLAQLLMVIPPSTYGQRDRFSGSVHEFLRASPANKEAAMALRSTIITRVTLPFTRGDPRRLRHEPGAYLTTDGARDNPGYRVDQRIRVPDGSTDLGRWLRYSQTLGTQFAVAFASFLHGQLRNCLGVAMTGATPGNYVEFHQTRMHPF